MHAVFLPPQPEHKQPDKPEPPVPGTLAHRLTHATKPRRQDGMGTVVVMQRGGYRPRVATRWETIIRPPPDPRESRGMSMIDFSKYD